MNNVMYANFDDFLMGDANRCCFISPIMYVQYAIGVFLQCGRLEGLYAHTCWRM